MQYRLALSFVVGCLLGLSGSYFWVAVGPSRTHEPDQYAALMAVREAPLTIAMSTVGDFSKGHSWYLSVNSAGQAQLSIATLPKPTQREFTISAKQLADLRKALLDERFFELGDRYGEVVPDGSTTIVTVTAGDVTKSVELHFLMNWVHNNRAKLREPSRAVRVGLVIRNWFEIPEAVDVRRYDRMVLEAAK
jgi:hypothetical protein